MHIRTFTLDDHPAAARLWKSAEGMHAPTLEECARKLERDPQLFLVAEDAGELIGVVMGTYDGRSGWIFRLAVDPVRRRAGIGRTLVAELERRFTELGVDRIRLLTVGGNTTARRFWSDLGFEEDEDVVLFKKDAGAASGSC